MVYASLSALTAHGRQLPFFLRRCVSAGFVLPVPKAPGLPKNGLSVADYHGHGGPAFPW